MTSRLTRERLEEIISDPMINQGSEFAMMARMALAAMDSEPVAYTDERNLGYIDRGRETAYLWGKQNSEAGDVPLYRHAQQPVVPEEKPMPNPLSMYEVDAVAAIAEVKGWNACRAAMLQAGNSPVIGIDPASGPDRTVEVRYVAPPGYVMVPKEPTETMINAWLSEVANWRGHVAGYKAMLAAAPQEVNGE